MRVTKIKKIANHTFTLIDNELPEGWFLSSLGDVADARPGKTPKKSEYRDNGIHRIVKFRDITAKGINYSEFKAAYVVDNPSVLKGLRYLSKGDVLVTASAHSGDQIGKKCAYVDRLPEVKGGVYFVGELLGIASNPKIMHSKWPYYWFLIDNGFREVQSAVAGVHLTSGRAQNMQLPLAPLDEQKRIVAKVEKLLARVNAARERLAKVQNILKRFRQSVLSAACSGRLTSDWREENQNVEPADELIKKLQEKRKNPIKFLSSETKNWVVSKVDEVFNSFGGGTPSKNNSEYWNGDIPWVSSGDVKNDKIEKGVLFITRKGLENSSARVCPPNSVIVVVRSGILKHTLPVSVVQKPLAINQDIKCFDSEDKKLNSWFFLNLKAYQTKILALNREGTTVQSVKYETLKNLSIDIPPSTEQDEIFRRIEALFKLAEKIEKRIAVATARAEKLTHAILAKAFQGELVPTEAELARREGRPYEPASALLAHVKAERESTASLPRRHIKGKFAINSVR